MPREFAHWLVLDRALERCEGRTVARLREEGPLRAAALLGAVLHDAPYYHRFGRGNFWKTANFLHGHADRDTLEPIRKLAAEIKGVTSSALEATVIGMLSHIAADIAFHPFVFYFTGNYYAKDRDERTKAHTRHRLFEVYLDAWSRAQGAAPFARQSISNLAAQVSDFEKVIAPALVIATSESNLSADPQLWTESVRHMGKLQEFFLSPMCGAVMRIVNAASQGKFEEWDALYAFRRKRVTPFFEKSHRYQNPVSGEWREDSCKVLLEKAIDRAVELINAFERGDLQDRRGESLNYGVYGVAPEAGRYFAPTDGWAKRTLSN